MRRKDRAIHARHDIDAIIHQCPVCRLGLSDEGEPYIVPLFFGYDGQRVYLHCADAGRKLDIVRRHPRVCVEFDRLLDLIPAPTPCAWSARYQSVIGFGTARIVEDVAEKQQALSLLMAHYGAEAHFSPAETESVTILCVELEEVSGKQRL